MGKKELLAGLLSLTVLGSANATWFGENVEKGADIMMMDLRYPWWAESTYNAHWNFFLVAPDRFSGYGGFTMGVESRGSDHKPNLSPDVQAAFRPGSVWSFWGANKAGEPVRVVTSSRFNYPRQYVGEGASGALGGRSWPIVRNRWYTMLMRIWTPIGPPNLKYSYIGRWVKDIAARRWYLYGVVRVPSRAVAFTGNAGFLEDFGHNGRSVRALHRRRGYYRRQGVWRKSDTVTYNVPIRNTYWVVNKLENNTVLAMELSGNRALLPFKLTGDVLESGKKHAFTIDEPPLPLLDRPGIQDVKAQSNGRQVLVSWTIPPSASPAFYHKVEVFDNPDCSGKPIAVHEQRMPSVRNVLFPAHVNRPTVRVSVADVFDQPAKPVLVEAAMVDTPKSAPAAATAPGLKYELVVRKTEQHRNVLYPVCEESRQSRTEKHFWVSLSELSDGQCIQRGITHGFNTELRGRRHSGYGFRFRGLLQVPKTGIYLFHMRGTDGYRIRIDQGDVLVFDGLHGPEPRTFSMNLAMGSHPLAVDYFVDKQEPFFSLEWEGPDLPRQTIPSSALRHEDVGTTPVAVIAGAKTKDDGTVDVAISLAASKGHSIDHVQLFLDDMQIARMEVGALRYTDLLPAGRHRLWTRTWYDRNTTVDSLATSVAVPVAPVVGWDVGIAGETDAVRNIAQTGPDSFAFVGEGEYVVYREMKRDFTLTCCIDRCLGRHGEPVNGSSWVGLTVRERAGANNYHWGREFGVFQTARGGLRTTPDWSDGGASRMSVQVLPKEHKWLRVVRQGSLWTAWISKDGTVWQWAATHYKALHEKVGAGIVFRALPQNAQMYFRAAVSHVSLVAGTPGHFALPAAAPARGTAKVDLTGVTVSPSSSEVVVRSSKRGLLRSVDGGKTWQPANGSLTGSANAVRSVAIHPTRPEVMLRATGNGTGPENSGLYRTEDGGVHWTKLGFPGDFDGVGPSALCGEVIAFHPTQPRILVVGCETEGLFRSEDGGASWKRVLPAGQRFTAVKFHPRDIRKNGDACVHALSCPDRFMPLLGRGDSGSATPVSVARDYVSNNSGKKFQLRNERADLGFLNLTFSDPSHGTFEIGTTHGLLHTFTDGRETYLFSEGVAVESFKPVIALCAGKVRDQSWPNVYAQALTPSVPGRVSLCGYARDIRWHWYSCSGAPAVGVVAITPCDVTATTSGREWWFLYSDGLYRLDRQKASLTKVLE